MTRTSARSDGCATDGMLEYYRVFAQGGFALVITEGTYIDEEASQAYLCQPGIANDAHVEAWRPIAQAVRDEGGAIVLQLMHAGALVQGNRFTRATLGPSAIRPKGRQMAMHFGRGDYAIPRALSTEGVHRIIDAFADSARRAQSAGFDGVEIHGANGYLLDQFLNPETNRRTDEYGGGTGNRVRLVAEVIDAVRRTVGTDYPVGIRVSQKKVNDHNHRWPGRERDARIIFTRLSQAGASYLHVTEHDSSKPAFGAGETLAQLARRYGSLPVIANGNLGDPTLARRLLADGSADLVAVAKTALANPDWPKRILHGRALDQFDWGMLEPVATLDNAAAWRNGMLVHS